MLVSCPSDSLFPYYEAIHHKVLDSEGISPYIEGQHSHLEGKKSNSITSLRLLSIRDSAIFTNSIAAKGRRGGVRNPLRDSPALRWYTASGRSRGRAPKLHWSDSNCTTWTRVHTEYTVITYHLSLLQNLKFNPPPLKTCKVAAFYYSPFVHVFEAMMISSSFGSSLWGWASCSICCGLRTYAMWQTMLAGYFLNTGGITT